MKELLKKIFPFLSMGRVVYRVPWAKGIFLTFDDGPDPEFTPSVLSILQEFSIPATFFTLGNKAREHPELVKAIVAQGHTVANHTYSHVDLASCGAKEIFQEIRQCSESIPDQRILRPPYGGINMFSMSLVIALRYKLVFWSIDSLDYRVTNPEQIIENVLKENPRHGDVILFHDNNEHILTALPVLIDKILSEGLFFKKF